MASLLFGAEKDANILILHCQNGFFSIHSKFSQARSVVKADINKLPFKSNSFGLIILKGILTNLNLPKKNQKIIFQNIFGLLSSDGILYLGIENKLSPSYFAENKISLINKYDKCGSTNNIFNKFLHSIFIVMKYHQTYLLLPRSYLNLLRKIGFKEVFLYGAPRGFNYPCILSSEKNVFKYYCTNLDSPRKAIKRFLIRLLNMIGSNKYFCYSHILTGRKSGV